MKYLILVLLILISLGVWFGPVRSIKIRHYCNYTASQWADSNAPGPDKPAFYQAAYNVCVRGR